MKFLSVLAIVGFFLNPSTACANNSVGSEASHFVGSAALASVSTVLIAKYFPQVKKPALKGFIIATSEALITEGVQRLTGGDYSALDAVCATAGAGLGAYATDKWYVAPRITSRDGERTYAVMVVKRF